MINKWILDNFKSIESREELEFRPLTIFTGANSSGKSTILQSILMISQTLQSGIVSRSIVMNGSIKKFGSYSDIVNQRQYKKDMTFGFDITDDEYAGRRFSSPWSSDVKSLSCEFVVGAQKDDDLQPYMKSLTLRSKDEDGNIATIDIARSGGPSDAVKEVLSSFKDVFETEELNYDIKTHIDERFSRIRFDFENSEAPIGVSFSHFLPYYFMMYYNKNERISARAFDRMLDGMPMQSRIIGRYGMEELDELSELIVEEGWIMAQEIFDKAKDKLPTRKKKELQNVFQAYKDNGKIFDLLTLIQLAGLPSSDCDKYLSAIMSKIHSLPPRYELERIPAHMIPGIDYTKEFFCEHIWYLGPLREEPKALYPLESDGSLKDVGYKGENTAAVFDFNRSQKVDSISPSAFEDLSDVKLKKRKVSLEKTVKEWLVYLGVASDIDSDDRGKIGHTLQISNDIKLKQDLTHVGVGVSQVLPILVMALLAEKGDVIILEQPELHLHPKVQTRLADFFVAMNALGKQCLIETHSEYLINRLRYLVAKSESSKVAKDTMIYFVEKEAGHSKYRPVTINKYGVIEDWPEGFFDESERIAAEILRAGMEKKAQEEGDDYEE